MVLDFPPNETPSRPLYKPEGGPNKIDHFRGAGCQITDLQEKQDAASRPAPNPSLDRGVMSMYAASRLEAKQRKMHEVRSNALQLGSDAYYAVNQKN
mmetsp:Transcript_25745/g.69880  ORF Transcript_25745/g.69880 Transcript_25745/m.69880 type:complete len:97 (-) Transcript_25745:705-995(-)